ncbi:MAG TPA: hypothetical protein VFX45_12735 [Solirubrobacterales bacterium]|nr:hypothetical protein [Solirubrobacterales bacterium]
MLLATESLGQYAAGAGLLAAGIAVGGFVFAAGPALAGQPEERLRQLTVIGGLFGLAVATLVIVLSAISSKVCP